MNSFLEKIFKNFEKISKNQPPINREWFEYPHDYSFKKNFSGLDPVIVLEEAVAISRICENLDHSFQFKIEENGILVWKFTSIEKFISFKQIVERNKELEKI